MMGFAEIRLVRRLQRGDRAACRELIAKHHAAVYGFLRSLGAGHETAEDLTQQTYAKVWEKVGTLRQVGSLRSWILTIARNELLQAARRRQPDLEPRAELPSIPDPQPGALTLLEEAERDRRLREAVHRLDSPLLEAVSLHYFQDLSLREVGRVLEIPVGTVKSRLHRALGILQTLLDEKEAGGVRKEAPTTIAGAL
jgi:RNA polymerase sigma-70 factor (ECF subfamily)